MRQYFPLGQLGRYAANSSQETVRSHGLCVSRCSLLFAACHNASSHGTSAIRVSLCELYENPAAYDGKLITLAATVTRLPDGIYLYPGTPSSECGYSFIGESNWPRRSGTKGRRHSQRLKFHGARPLAIGASSVSGPPQCGQLSGASSEWSTQSLCHTRAST